MMAEKPFPDEARARAVRAIAVARAECVSLGIGPDELGQLLVEEAALAWLIAGHDEARIKADLDAVVQASVAPWLARLRHRSGLCDCVAEVHFTALCETSVEPLEERDTRS